MRTPCTVCGYKFGQCADGDATCKMQDQCKGCIFWYGTGAFSPDYCEIKIKPPDGACSARLLPPEPEKEPEP